MMTFGAFPGVITPEDSLIVITANRGDSANTDHQCSLNFKPGLKFVPGSCGTRCGHAIFFKVQ